MERIFLHGVQAEVARSLWARMRGLLGRTGLPPGEGLLIENCRAIHTCGMRFAIDALFLDGRNRVVKAVRNIPPGRLFVWGGWRARKVLETAALADRWRGRPSRCV